MTEIRNWHMKRKKQITDVVSSIASNNDYHLTVVSNNEKSEDKEEFARTVVYMCIDNSFHIRPNVNYKKGRASHE